MTQYTYVYTCVERMQEAKPSENNLVNVRTHKYEWKANSHVFAFIGGCDCLCVVCAVFVHSQMCTLNRLPVCNCLSLAPIFGDVVSYSNVRRSNMYCAENGWYLWKMAMRATSRMQVHLGTYKVIGRFVGKWCEKPSFVLKTWITSTVTATATAESIFRNNWKIMHSHAPA